MTPRGGGAVSKAGLWGGERTGGLGPLLLPSPRTWPVHQRVPPAPVAVSRCPVGRGGCGERSPADQGSLQLLSSALLLIYSDFQRTTPPHLFTFPALWLSPPPHLLTPALCLFLLFFFFFCINYLGAKLPSKSKFSRFLLPPPRFGSLCPSPPWCLPPSPFLWCWCHFRGWAWEGGGHIFSPARRPCSSHTRPFQEGCFSPSGEGAEPWPDRADLAAGGIFPGEGRINSSPSPHPEWSNLSRIQIPEEGLSRSGITNSE